MAGTYNFPEYYTGDTFKGLEITLYNETTAQNIDLTGATIRCHFKSDKSSPNYSLALSTGSGITVTDASGGVFEIDPFDIDLPACKYYYDIEVTFSDSTVVTYVKGVFNVLQDVTR